MISDSLSALESQSRTVCGWQLSDVHAELQSVHSPDQRLQIDRPQKHHTADEQPPSEAQTPMTWPEVQARKNTTET